MGIIENSDFVLSDVSFVFSEQKCTELEEPQNIDYDISR